MPQTEQTLPQDTLGSPYLHPLLTEVKSSINHAGSLPQTQYTQFGGISGTLQIEPNRFLMISDDTRRNPETGVAINNGARIYEVVKTPQGFAITAEHHLRNDQGNLLPPLDLEAITQRPDGMLVLAAEGNREAGLKHELLVVHPETFRLVERIDLSPLATNLRDNDGFESIGTLPDGRLILVTEQPEGPGQPNLFYSGGRFSSIYILTQDGELEEQYLMPLTPPSPLSREALAEGKTSKGGASDLYVSPEGRVYVLERSFVPDQPENSGNGLVISEVILDRATNIAMRRTEDPRLIYLDALLGNVTPVETRRLAAVAGFNGNVESLLIQNDTAFLVVDNNFNPIQGLQTDILSVPLRIPHPPEVPVRQ
jgi:Esterase-like activity of phytase